MERCLAKKPGSSPRSVRSLEKGAVSWPCSTGSRHGALRIVTDLHALLAPLEAAFHRVRLGSRHHQQTKNLLVGYSGKALGFF